MKKILIFSPKRSGSTFFRHILSKDNRIEILNETHFITDFKQKGDSIISKASFLKILSNHNRLNQWFKEIDDFNNFIGELEHGKLTQYVDLFFEFCGKDSDNVGDKTPEYIEDYEKVLDIVKPHLIILFSREPLYITESLRKRTWEGNTPSQRAKYINKVFRNMQRIKESHSNCVEVKYEDLFEKKSLTLSKKLSVKIDLDIKKTINITEKEYSSGLHDALTSKPVNKNIKFLKSGRIKYNKWLLRESYSIYNNSGKKYPFKAEFLLYLMKDYIIELVYPLFRFVINLYIFRKLKNKSILQRIKKKFYTK